MPDRSKPSQTQVAEFHTNSDQDGSGRSQHHTLGSGATQASPGNHVHDGGNSSLIMAGITLTGSKASGAALLSVISALSAMGAVDNTVA